MAGKTVSTPGSGMIGKGPQVPMKSLDMSKQFALKQPKKGPSFSAPKKP